MTTPRKPEFRITLQERKSHHMFERHPRYDVLVNGERQGELYFNLRGYVGYLPMVQGSRMDIGEKAISAFRKEVGILNREAARAIEGGLHDSRKLALIFPTEDSRIVFALSRDEMDGTDQVQFLSRREILQAKKLFGTTEVGVGFFNPHDGDPDDLPVVLFEEEDRALAAGLMQIRSRIIDRFEAETHIREIAHVFETADPDIRLVVSRRTIDGVDSEPHYVTNASLQWAKIVAGDQMRLSDLTLADARPAITDEDGRSLLRGEFTWFDVDGVSDVSPGSEENLSSGPS